METTDTVVVRLRDEADVLTIARLQAENEALRRERDEYAQIFALHTKAAERARILWRNATGRRTWDIPDRAALMVWLMEHVDASEAAREAAEAKAARLEKAAQNAMKWWPEEARHERGFRCAMLDLRAALEA